MERVRFLRDLRETEEFLKIWMGWKARRKDLLMNSKSSKKKKKSKKAPNIIV